MRKAIVLICLVAGLAGCSRSYNREDAVFQNGDVSLAGTLYTPSVRGPHPAIIFIHGSGADTRENYRLYAELFAENGIAALIYDKRGNGASTGDWRLSPFSILAGDALAGVGYLKSHPIIDPKRIGVWGGSEGGIIAPWVASRSSDVAFVIMQSATGCTFAEQNLYQNEQQIRALTNSEQDVAERLAIQRLLHHYARTGTGWQKYAEAIQAARGKPWASSLGETLPPDHWWWNWYRTKMDFDPGPMLENVKAPVLAVWGGRDILVPVAKSRMLIESAFTRGGNRDVTYQVFGEADHSLHSNSLLAGQRPDPEYLKTMINWTLKQVRLPK